MIKKLIVICAMLFLVLGGCKLTGLDVKLDEVDTGVMSEAVKDAG